ncbi:unnamed protein product [Peniophora sp. CBMAI 1063]|nr:unnamed protein product [Peniophora sp. CBMAI 1063]
MSALRDLLDAWISLLQHAIMPNRAPLYQRLCDLVTRSEQFRRAQCCGNFEEIQAALASEWKFVGRVSPILAIAAALVVTRLPGRGTATDDAAELTSACLMLSSDASLLSFGTAIFFTIFYMPEGSTSPSEFAEGLH